MKSRFVDHRFLKPDKNRVSDRSLRRNAIACKLPQSCCLLTKSVRLIRAENKRTQLCLQIELAEEKSQSQSLHSQNPSQWKQQMPVMKKKSLLWMLKKFCMKARNMLLTKIHSLPVCQTSDHISVPSQPIHTCTSLHTREPQIHHKYTIFNTIHISLVPCYLNMYNTHIIRTSSPHITVKAYSRTIMTAA